MLRWPIGCVLSYLKYAPRAPSRPALPARRCNLDLELFGAAFQGMEPLEKGREGVSR